MRLLKQKTKPNKHFAFIFNHQNSELEKNAKLRANKIIDHNFTVLSKRIKFGKKINWHSNFMGKSWPLLDKDILNQKYLSDFNSRFYIGDIKLPWELSKHLYFQDLARAFLSTKQEKYLNEFTNEIKDWLDANPYQQGVNWTQGLIVAHRAISWVIALSVFDSFIEPPLKRKIVESLYLHADFISENYEIGNRSTNHLIGELCSMIFICNYLPRNSNIDKYLVFAVAELEKQVLAQIYIDGVDYEQSLSYHRYIIEFLFLPLILDKRGLIKISSKIRARTEKMVEFLMHMTQPSGFYQPISDADGARVFLLDNDVLDSRPYLAMAAWIFNRPDFLMVGAPAISRISWFLKERELETLLKTLPKLPLAKSVMFPQGGYAISRQSWDDKSSWLFFDCGSIGLGEWDKDLEIGTHGHSDTLNFGFSLGKQTIFTDIGSYSYTTEHEYHQYFRSAKGHNAPLVDKQDQNIVSQIPWTLKQYAPGTNFKSFFSDKLDYISGEHCGYERLHRPLKVRREIIHSKIDHYILIRDQFLGVGDHLIEENFHLHPEVVVKKKINGFVLNNMIIFEPLSSGFSSRKNKGKKNPPCGWYANDYGKKSPTVVLQFKKTIIAPDSLFFLLNWGKNNIDLSQAQSIFDSIQKKINKPKIALLFNTNMAKVYQKKIELAVINGFEARAFIPIDNCDSDVSCQEDGLIVNYLYPENKELLLKRKIKLLFKKYAPRVCIKIARIMRKNNVESSLNNKKDSTTILRQLRFFCARNRSIVDNVIKFDPQIVRAHDIDTLFTGYLIKRKIGAKLFYDRPKSLSEQSQTKSIIKKFIFSKIEQFLLGKIDTLSKPSRPDSPKEYIAKTRSNTN